MIDYTTSDILNLYKEKYFEQNGSPIQIGSNDFAAATVHAYVLGIMVGAFNREAGNCLIDSATGDSLDGIARTFGIERPSGYRATIRVNFTYKTHGGIPASFIPENDIVITHGGKKFTNIYTLTVYNNGISFLEQTLYAMEPGSDYNNIPASASTTIDSGEYWIDSVQVVSDSDGGTDGFPHTEEGDNAFCEWLKTEIKTLAGAGTYLAYEAKARNADPRVLDVHVLRQDETGYEKGKVKICVHTNDATGDVLDAVENQCNDPAFRPIGDLVVVAYSGTTQLTSPATIQVTYLPQFSGDCAARTSAIISEYKAELLATIGKPFCFAEICRRFITADADGVYAIDAKPLGVSASAYLTPIYPDPGKRIDLLSLQTDIQVGGV